MVVGGNIGVKRGVGRLKNPWGTHRIDVYDFWVILKIEFFPENLSIGCCAAILNRDVFDLFDLFSIGSCAAILNRDFFDLFDFLLKRSATITCFCRKMSFWMILRATGATGATEATRRERARNPGTKIQSLHYK